MSGFCNSLLGKDIYDIKENDLINFFKNEQEETNTLEFKSGEVEIHKLCKEICAFLNTEGGLIIIGSPKEKKKKIGKSNYIVCQGELTSSQFPNKDWLYQKINSRITPIPTKLRIQEIKSEKNLCFVIEVNQSFNPPHQLDSEGRYYIRIEREARPAPHGIVDAFFNRRQHPNPATVIVLESISESKDLFQCEIVNKSKVTAESIEGYISIYGINNIIPQRFEYENTIKKSNGVYEIRFPRISYIVKGLSNKSTFEIEHNNFPYLIHTTIWCKHSSVITKSVIYSPIEKQIIEKKHKDDDEIEFSVLKDKIDVLQKDRKEMESRSFIENCNYLKIEAKNNVGNLITIHNAYTSNLKDYSTKYVEVSLRDNSGSYNKCFVKKESELVKFLNNNPHGSFIGQIENEPEMYSFIINDIYI